MIDCLVHDCDTSANVTPPSSQMRYSQIAHVGTGLGAYGSTLVSDDVVS